jgi:hypothetical protein
MPQVRIEPTPVIRRDPSDLTNDLKVEVNGKSVSFLSGIIEDREDRNIDSLIAFAGGDHEGVDAFLAAVKRFNSYTTVDKRGTNKNSHVGKCPHMQRSTKA